MTSKDRGWIKELIKERWGSEKIVSRGKVYYSHKLPSFVAVKNKKYLGLVTYNIKRDSLEIVSLDSFEEKMGVGTALVEEVKKAAKRSGCKRLWLITTNDNIDALRFWQKRGFSLKAVYPNAMSYSRKLKPEIPLIGSYGIPIRDEIELEFKIKKKIFRHS